MSKMHSITTKTQYLVAFCIFALACGDSDKTEPIKDNTPSHANADDHHHPPTKPTEIYVDLDGDGEKELLPKEVEDRRVEYVFGEDERHGPEGDDIDDHDHEHPDDRDHEPDIHWQVDYDELLFIDIPAVVAPAGADQLNCVIGTWSGPDMGIVNSHFAADPKTNHHLLLFGLPKDWGADIPDGKLFNCDFGTTGKHVVAPLYTWSMNSSKYGIGTRLKKGQRYYLELHTVNYLTHPVLVNAAYRLQLVEIEKLKALSAEFKLGPNQVAVQPGDYHIKFTYTWPKDTSILRVRAHMHEYGKWFALDWTSSKGTKRIIEVDPWEYDHVSGKPPGQDYENGEFKVSAGDTFTTHCRWDNPKNEVITSPKEMCNTFGVALLDEAIDQDEPFEVVE